MTVRKGYSLIEVLLCTAIAVMLLFAVGSALMATLAAVRVNDTQIRARLQAERVLRLIASEIRRAGSIGLEQPTDASATTYSRLWTLQRTTGAIQHWTIFELSGDRLMMKKQVSNALGQFTELSTVALTEITNGHFRSAVEPDNVCRSVILDLTLSCGEAVSSQPMSFPLSGTASSRALARNMLAVPAPVFPTTN